MLAARRPCPARAPYVSPIVRVIGMAWAAVRVIPVRKSSTAVRRGGHPGQVRLDTGKVWMHECSVGSLSQIQYF
jgi:hypothetical protein